MTCAGKMQDGLFPPKSMNASANQKHRCIWSLQFWHSIIQQWRQAEYIYKRMNEKTAGVWSWQNVVLKTTLRWLWHCQTYVLYICGQILLLWKRHNCARYSHRALQMCTVAEIKIKVQFKYECVPIVCCRAKILSICMTQPDKYGCQVKALMAG